MKFVFNLLIYLFFAFQLLSAKEDLCIECSQNLGSGFYFNKPDPTKGIQLVSSAVGIIASEPINASDGSVLISGYMPVCVVPILGLGAPDTSVCSNKEITLSSNAYLINNIDWEELTNSLNFTREGTYEESIRVNQKVNKVEKYTIQVAAEKGGIKSMEDEVEISIYPEITPKLANSFSINDTNIVCNNKDVVIDITDDYYSLDSLEITWNDTNLKSFTENIEIKSELVTKTVTIRNKNNENLCDTTFTLYFNPIKPNATVSIQSKGNITVLNPADYENEDNTFYFDVTVNGNEDYKSALERCPPKFFEAEVEIPKKLFYPKGVFSILTENPTTKTIKYNGSYPSKNEIFSIVGIPILVDQTSGEIKINSFKFLDDENNDKIYDINVGEPFPFSLVSCDDFNGEKRLLKDYFAPMIKNVYPNPTNSIINVELDLSGITGNLVSIVVFDNMGFEVLNYSILRESISNKLQIILPQHLPSGIYKAVVSDGINLSNFEYLLIR